MDKWNKLNAETVNTNSIQKFNTHNSREFKSCGPTSVQLPPACTVAAGNYTRTHSSGEGNQPDTSSVPAKRGSRRPGKVKKHSYSEVIDANCCQYSLMHHGRRSYTLYVYVLARDTGYTTRASHRTRNTQAQHLHPGPAKTHPQGPEFLPWVHHILGTDCQSS